MNNLDSLIAIKDRYADKWMGFDDVFAVGIGYKITDGKKTDTLCISVLTTKKKSLATISEGQCLPRSVEGTAVDVVEMKGIREFDQQEGDSRIDPNMYRPMQGGIQLSHLHEKTPQYISIAFGTLGMFVREKANPKQLYILTNWHVLSKKDMDIYQPNYSGTRAAQLLVAEAVKGDYYECADAGIAKVTVPIEDIRANSILEFGEIKGAMTGRPQLNQLVKKRGRTTGVTHGQINYIGVTVSNGTQVFKDQVIAKGIDEGRVPVADGGDSGSVVLTYDIETGEKNNIVSGLLWGGNTEDNSMVFSPIHYVFEYLGVELCD